MSKNLILANLRAAIDFFNAMIKNLYEILTINPVTYRGGAIWEAVGNVYNAIMGLALSMAIIFFFIGLIEEAGEFIKHKNAGPVIWAFIKLMFLSAILIGGRYIMMLIFFAGKEFIDAIILKNGLDVLSVTEWSLIPDSVENAAGGLTTSSGIVFWVVTLMAALVVMVSCFVIMFVVYGRLFKIYLHIAIAPIPLACFASKTVKQHFVAFIRSFTGVILEGIVIIVACIIFTAFANGFDINNPLDTDNAASVVWSTEDREELTEEEKESAAEALEEARNDGTPVAEITAVTHKATGDTAADNAELMWKYLAEMLFLFLMLASVIKASGDTVRKMIGV